MLSRNDLCLQQAHRLEAMAATPLDEANPSLSHHSPVFPSTLSGSRRPSVSKVEDV